MRRVTVLIRVLFDKNVPVGLRDFLRGCNVVTAGELEWGQLENGELLLRAELSGFTLLITCDQNVRYQQNLLSRRISMIVLGSNHWPSVREKAAEIAAAVSRCISGSFEFIEISHPERKRRLPAP